MLKYTIQNFGPIKEVEFDLSKRLTLLCGPNGTGKTYGAYAIYALYDWLRDKRQISKVVDALLKPLEDQKIAANELEIDLIEFLDQHQSALFEEINKQVSACLNDLFPGEEFDATKLAIALISQGELKDKLISTSWQSEKSWSERPLTVLPFNRIHNSQFIFHSIIFSKEKGDVEIRINPPNLFFNPHNISVNDHIILWIIQQITKVPVFFPAERAAINLFHKEIFLNRFDLIEEESQSGDLRKRSQRYPKPIADALKIAVDLQNLQHQQSKVAFSSLADRLEEEILAGKITISQYGEIQFSPEGTDVTLGFHRSASIVKSLSSLVFYLRHQAKEGDIIIIDEPELNLHPDNQRKVARVLAEIANAGIKVVLSTHSDYIIREFNNLIMLSTEEHPARKAEIMAKYGYRDTQVLQPEAVGAYLFLADEVRNLKVDATGFEVETIDAEINKLNDTTNEIYFNLHNEDAD